MIINTIGTVVVFGIIIHNTITSTHSFTMRPHHHHHDQTILVHSLPSLVTKTTLQSSPSSYQNEVSNKKKKIGIYIHIPYCRKRCRYCDFAIVPIGGRNSNQDADKQQKGFETMNHNYTNAILTEIDCLIESIILMNQYTNENDRDGDQRIIQLDSIYFGGGTPSLAPISTIQSILHHLLRPRTMQDSSTEINNTVSIFRITNETEITMECDPGTFSLQYLQGIKKLGINRISLGVQSFNDDILSYIGRMHTKQDILKSIDLINQVYGSGDCANDASNNSLRSDNGVNYSIDLISGLPGLNNTLWMETLQTAMTLKPKPNHLSVYDLQIEKGTVFGSWYDANDDDDENYLEGEHHRNKKHQMHRSTLEDTQSKFAWNGNLLSGKQLELPTPDDCAYMYEYASDYLSSNGFEHYEISSYARKKLKSISSSSSSYYRSQHNQIYWEIDSEWYALGLGATSCIDKLRYARPKALSDYIEWTEVVKDKMSLWSSMAIDDNNGHFEDGMLPPWFDENQSWEQVLEDIIMTRLRTKEGLDLNWIVNQVKGEEILKCIIRGSKLGFELGMVKRDIDKIKRIDRLYLSDPKGFLFSNSIISSIFAEVSTISFD